MIYCKHEALSVSLSFRYPRFIVEVVLSRMYNDWLIDAMYIDGCYSTAVLELNNGGWAGGEMAVFVFVEKETDRGGCKV